MIKTSTLESKEFNFEFLEDYKDLERDLSSLVESEERLIQLSGLDPSDIKSYPVQIDYSRESSQENTQESGGFWGFFKSFFRCRQKSVIKEKSSVYLWTYEFGDPTKPTLVFLHGYIGASLLYFKGFNFLKQHFHVYMVDLLGMGRSSRLPFDCENYEDCEEWFNSSIHAWINAMSINKYVLLGHSLGAFIAAKYATKYPEGIIKLILLSCYSVEKTSDRDLEKYYENQNSEPFGPRMFSKALDFFLDQGYSPCGWMRYAGKKVSKMVLNQCLDVYKRMLKREEIDAIGDYLTNLIQLNGSSEYCVPIMFPTKSITKYALWHDLENLKKHNIELSFYYADDDWCNTDYNGNLVSDQLKEEGYRVYIIPKSNHQLMASNSQETCRSLFDDISNSEALSILNKSFK
ncbi:unnamed protein product [Moneuplotes crassus]|uniref:AB hydrolase-1 domain-containing protein n=1 Tax=Euplotes crassus TaxID=5936 RepID=A0AAD1UIR9_EUPCR|nr:unnamed protein product [Moneuplotes crassus]